jgi:intracellular sulfur oxidation DsrE/DsrF family protein
LPIVKPVPMGALKIYELKKEGYIYITNPWK